MQLRNQKFNNRKLQPSYSNRSRRGINQRAQLVNVILLFQAPPARLAARAQDLFQLSHAQLLKIRIRVQLDTLHAPLPPREVEHELPHPCRLEAPAFVLHRAEVAVAHRYQHLLRRFHPKNFSYSRRGPHSLAKRHLPRVLNRQTPVQRRVGLVREQQHAHVPLCLRPPAATKQLLKRSGVGHLQHVVRDKPVRRGPNCRRGALSFILPASTPVWREKFNRWVPIHVLRLAQLLIFFAVYSRHLDYPFRLLR